MTTMLLFADTHIPARARRLPDAVLRAVDGADIVVHAGDWMDVATLDLIEARHSHIPWDTTTPGGMRLLNPGSPTDRRRQPVCTMMSLEIRPSGLEATVIPVNRTNQADSTTRRAH